MYIKTSDSGAGYELPANYGGTALQEPPSPPTDPPESTEAVEAAYQPPPPPHYSPPENLPLLSRLFGGNFANSDLLLIAIALLIYGEDGDSLVPLLIIALLVFAK